ncbi:hypothetical protein RJ640_000088, partial [Escallonia rubra]
YLRFLTRLRPKMLKIHHKVDQILDDIIREHRENSEIRKKGNFGQNEEEDLVDVLLRLQSIVREECEIEGFKVPINTKVFINAWAIGRDPNYWNDTESFIPERFENTSLDFTGNSLEYFSFGARRRICAGTSLGITNVELPLVQLLRHFNWKLPSDIRPQHLDMTETLGATPGRKENLFVIATSNS